MNLEPFLFPILATMLRSKRFSADFVQQFPEIKNFLINGQIVNAKSAFEYLNSSGSDWKAWTRNAVFEHMSLQSAMAEHIQAAIDYAKHLQAQKSSAQIESDKQFVPRKSQMEKDGPEIWRALHVAALEWNGDRQRLANAINRTTTAVPCGECKKHWIEMIQQKPITAKTAEEFFALTVEWHNEVNARLGKPQLTIEEAKAIYRAS